MNDEREFEIPKHRKKSDSADKSVSAKRADHRHDYEKVIIQEDTAGSTDPLKRYYWGKRCRICGRVVDRGQFKSASREGLVKKTVRIAGSRIDVYFTADELHEKYPDTPILIANSDWSGYEGLIIRKEGNNND